MAAGLVELEVVSVGVVDVEVVSVGVVELEPGSVAALDVVEVPVLVGSLLAESLDVSLAPDGSPSAPRTPVAVPTTPLAVLDTAAVAPATAPDASLPAGVEAGRPAIVAAACWVLWVPPEMAEPIAPATLPAATLIPESSAVLAVGPESGLDVAELTVVVTVDVVEVRVD